ncbi:aminotransferase class I/II-fold pyridoxal phosphate-dependent enzyme [Pelagibacteraceae bacterium]|nr:aminotransferase class I/II-fold pyridoxal phosphate-dependent enzyme [Pelagibacteraceae bacterium]|tara:strand:- start:504 stop:1742 length:1239 start_codon:yes stop_codon:yes gene_type:complete
MKNLVKKNISSLKPSSTLVINEKSKELISQGKKVYQFGFGQSPFPVPQKIVDTLKDNAHKKEYLPIQGLPKLREAISKYLLKKTGVNYPEKNILITPGSKEAMLLMHVAFKGEIILPAPSWVSYEPQAKIGLNKVHWLQTLRENNWFPTPKELERKIKSVGKNKNIILILNSPNNPSGTVCKNLKELSIVAKKHKIIILSDEIYTDLTFCNKYESISKYYPEATFISGGLSKWCGAGGWRLGFFAVPENLSNFLESLKSLASESYSTVNTPIQYAAVEAYNGDYNNYKNNVTKILNSVGQYVYNKLKSNKVLINPPQGAFYLMPEFLNNKYKSSSELCEAILSETGVAMLPASDFGFKPNKMLTRLSYTDFNGNEFLRNIPEKDNIKNDLIERYAPNVVEGIQKLSIWAKKM